MSDADVSPEATRILDIVRFIKERGNVPADHAINLIPVLAKALDQRRATAENEIAVLNSGGGWMHDRIRTLTTKLEVEHARATEDRQRAEQVRDIQRETIKALRATLRERDDQYGVANQRIAQLDQAVRESTDPQYQDRVRIVTAQRDRLRARLGVVLRKLGNAQRSTILLETMIPDSEYCVACCERVHTPNCPIGQVRRAFGEQQYTEYDAGPTGDAWHPEDSYDSDYDAEEPPDEEEDDGTWGNGEDGY